MTPWLASILVTALASHPAAPSDSAERRPLIAMFVQGAFEVGGLATGDTPLAILYQDGTVIYCVRRTQAQIQFDSVRLSGIEMKALLDSLQLEPDFFMLQDHYNNLPGVSDMGFYTFRAWHGDTMKTVTLVGTFDSNFVGVRLTRTDLAAATPPVLARLFNLLCNYRHPGGHPWQPSEFAAIATDFPDSVEAPRPWPRGWPTIEGPGARRDSLGTYRFPLAKAQFTTFLQKYSRAVNEQPFAMAGRNWFVRVRVVIPGDKAWVN